MLNLLELERASSCTGIDHPYDAGPGETGCEALSRIIPEQFEASDGPEGTLHRRNVPQSSTPKVKAGQQITRGKYGTGPGGIGTASVIVRKKGASTGACLLTCAHVLGMAAIGVDAAVKDANAVYSPKFKECCNIECNRPFGQVVTATLETIPERVIQASVKIGAEVFAVDAALIEVTSDANALNDIPKIGQIAGVRDLIQEWSLTTVQTNLELPPARQILVKKYGATTEYTEGTIRRLVRQHTKETAPGSGTVTENDALLLEIEVNAGQPQFSEEYELDMDRFMSKMAISTADEVVDLFKNTKVAATKGGSSKTPTLKVVGTTFSQAGDSGSPIVDKDGNIVGILRSGTVQTIYVKGQDDPVDIVTGNSQGVFISAAFEKLQVTFLPAGQQTAGERIIVPGMAIERGNREAMDWEAFDRTRVAIENSPAGARLAPPVQRHFGEVRQLIHHRRRVTVTWHRSKGPGFVAALLRFASRPSEAIPHEIDGVRLLEAMHAMRNVLMTEGSQGLQAAIVEHELDLFKLAEQATSFDVLLAAFAAFEERYL